MQKWEYCYFVYGVPETVVLLTSEGEVRNPVQGCGGLFRSTESKAGCAVAQLGEDGWEAFTPRDSRSGMMWFKRPK